MLPLRANGRTADQTGRPPSLLSPQLVASICMLRRASEESPPSLSGFRKLLIVRPALTEPRASARGSLSSSAPTNLSTNFGYRTLEIDGREHFRGPLVERPADGDEALDRWQIRAAFDGTDLRYAQARGRREVFE